MSVEQLPTSVRSSGYMPAYSGVMSISVRLADQPRILGFSLGGPKYLVETVESGEEYRPTTASFDEGQEDHVTNHLVIAFAGAHARGFKINHSNNTENPQWDKEALLR